MIDGGVSDPPGTGVDLYEEYAAVRAAYEHAAECTGLAVGRLLSWDKDPATEIRQVGAIRRAAVVFGLCDVLADRSIRPDVVGGMSMGGLIGAGVSGAIGRSELFGLLARLREVPPPGGPAQGLAQLRLPAGAELRELVGSFPEGVYVSAEIGPTPDGSAQLLLISGYREALAELARKLPDEAAIQLAPDAARAFHSPLQGYVRDFLEPHIAITRFHDPGVPLCGGLAPGAFVTADDVRDLFRRNHTDPISLPLLLGNLDRHGTELAFLLGPAMVDRYLGAAKHAIVHIDSRSHLSAAFEAIHEFGVTPPGGRRG